MEYVLFSLASSEMWHQSQLKNKREREREKEIKNRLVHYTQPLPEDTGNGQPKKKKTMEHSKNYL